MPQKAQSRKRKYDEEKADLVVKVVEETRRLKKMRHAFEARILDGPATDTSACFSAIRASLEQGSRKHLPESLHNSSVAQPAVLSVSSASKERWHVVLTRRRAVSLLASPYAL